jgi:hypothetical protein
MRKRLASTVAACATTLLVAAPALARPQTTNAPQMLTIKVILTDTGVTMRPNVVARGSTAVFVVSNRGTKPQTMLLGDVKRGDGKKIGFSSKLGPNEQKTFVMFLDYRGLLPFASTGAHGGSKLTVRGTFRIS